MFWMDLLFSILFVVGVAFLFWAIYQMAMRNLKEQFRMVARWELQDDTSGLGLNISSEDGTEEVSEDEKLYELTEAGKHLKRIKDDGELVMMVGAMFALIVVICYWIFLV